MSERTHCRNGVITDECGDMVGCVECFATGEAPILFIGGDSHGHHVPDADQHRYFILVGIQRYMRHAGHFVIFGMSPQRVAELIGELQA